MNGYWRQTTSTAQRSEPISQVRPGKPTFTLLQIYLIPVSHPTATLHPLFARSCASRSSSLIGGLPPGSESADLHIAKFWVSLQLSLLLLLCTHWSRLGESSSRSWKTCSRSSNSLEWAFTGTKKNLFLQRVLRWVLSATGMYVQLNICVSIHWIYATVWGIGN